MEPKHSLPCSQELSMCPYTVPDDTFHALQSHLFEILFILSSHLCVGLPNILFPSDFSTKILHPFFWVLSLATGHAISSSSFDCLSIVCCRVQTSLSSCVALHNLLPPHLFFLWWGVSPSPTPPPRRIFHCHLSTVLYSVHFVIIPAAWGCAMPRWWSHLTWPLTVSHAIYHFALIFCNFWDTFSLKCGRYRDHKEQFMWRIKKMLFVGSHWLQNRYILILACEWSLISDSILCIHICSSFASTELSKRNW